MLVGVCNPAKYILPYKESQLNWDSDCLSSTTFFVSKGNLERLYLDSYYVFRIYSYFLDSGVFLASYYLYRTADVTSSFVCFYIIWGHRMVKTMNRYEKKAGLSVKSFDAHVLTLARPHLVLWLRFALGLPLTWVNSIASGKTAFLKILLNSCSCGSIISFEGEINCLTFWWTYLRKHNFTRAFTRFPVLPAGLHLGGPNPNCHTPGLDAPFLYKLLIAVHICYNGFFPRTQPLSSGHCTVLTSFFQFTLSL